MTSRDPSKDHESEPSIKGCAEYRLAAELTLLRRRLQTEMVEEEERSAIERRIVEIEKALGV